MSTAAGDRITAARLNPAAFQLQLAANYTLTATATDLTLTNVTPGYASGTMGLTVPEGGMTGLAVWTGDFQLTAGGTITFAIADLVVDGALPTGAPSAVYDPGNTTDGRATCAGHWPLSLAAGAHTFGLRARVSSTSGTVILNTRHTALSILLHP